MNTFWMSFLGTYVPVAGFSAIYECAMRVNKGKYKKKMQEGSNSIIRTYVFSLVYEQSMLTTKATNKIVSAAIEKSC